jgi:hypothetical protein
MSLHRLVVLAIACVLASLPATATANGRFPTAQHVLIGPGTTSDTIVLRTTFGLVISDDRGKTFRYVCEEAMGYGGAAFDPAIGLDGTSRMLVGLYDGAIRLSPDRCDGPGVPTLAGQFVSDVDTNVPGDVMAVSTATGFTADRNYIFRSIDSGATFTRLGPGELGVQFATLELADTDDRRLYATALQLVPRRVVVYRSDDGGETLVDLTSFPAPDSIGAYVAAIDPKKPDTVYVRTIVAKTPGPGRQTVLHRTDDAGLTWTEVGRTNDLMTGFAISGDGTTLWMGGTDPSDGLQRSTDRGATWKRIADTKVQCLRWHEGVLYVCATNEVDHYALGRSCDDGDTIHPLLGFSSIAGVFPCPASSKETTACPSRLDAIRLQFPVGDRPVEECGTTTIDAGLDTSINDAADDAETASPLPDALPDVDASVPNDTAIASDDASLSPEATLAGSGCNCSLEAAKRARGEAWSIVLALGGIVIARRRARRRT